MILIGTSGYSYPDWGAAFYPEGLARKDFLAFYAAQFKTLELNSSYYAIPQPSLVENLVRHTPENFQVTVKAYRGITHEKERAGTEGLEAFKEAIRPLERAGKLGAVLLQFPHGFGCTRANARFLEKLLEKMREFPRVVEFRHAGWMNRQAWELLRAHGAALCCVDEPRLPGLVPPEVVCTSGQLGYVRFHGRNSEKWWRHDQAWERYDYLYPAGELSEWLKGIRWLAGKTDKTFIFFNNHRNAQAVKNARDMAHLLDLETPGENNPPPAVKTPD